VCVCVCTCVCVHVCVCVRAHTHRGDVCLHASGAVHTTHTHTHPLSPLTHTQVMCVHILRVRYETADEWAGKCVCVSVCLSLSLCVCVCVRARARACVCVLDSQSSIVTLNSEYTRAVTFESSWALYTANVLGH